MDELHCNDRGHNMQRVQIKNADQRNHKQIWDKVPPFSKEGVFNIINNNKDNYCASTGEDAAEKPLDRWHVGILYYKWREEEYYKERRQYSARNGDEAADKPAVMASHEPGDGDGDGLQASKPRG